MLLSVTEAADRLGISKSSVHNYIAGGQLRPERARPPIVFTEEAIAAFRPPRQGRPRLYASAAEKQRAYRERKARRNS